MKSYKTLIKTLSVASVCLVMAACGGGNNVPDEPINTELLGEWSLNLTADSDSVNCGATTAEDVAETRSFTLNEDNTCDYVAGASADLIMPPSATVSVTEQLVSLNITADTEDDTYMACAAGADVVKFEAKIDEMAIPAGGSDCHLKVEEEIYMTLSGGSEGNSSGVTGSYKYKSEYKDCDMTALSLTEDDEKCEVEAEVTGQFDTIPSLGDVDPTGDDDLDTILNDTDNCINDANTDQADADLDGMGDVCDVCPADFNELADGSDCPGGPDTPVDSDGDGHDDISDNCPDYYDESNECDADTDDDGLCDVADLCDGNAIDPDADAANTWYFVDSTAEGTESTPTDYRRMPLIFIDGTSSTDESDNLTISVFGVVEVIDATIYDSCTATNLFGVNYSGICVENII